MNISPCEVLLLIVLLGVANALGSLFGIWLSDKLHGDKKS